MRASTALTPSMSWLLLLASCSSPPQPPAVNEAQKRPVNSQMAVELQVCRSDLHNNRILVTESVHRAEAASATLANMTARQQILVAMQAPAKPVAQPNSVFSVHFDFASTSVVIAADIAPDLIKGAKAAPLVLLRGRTDGTSDTAAESRIARERAAAVRDYMVAAGVDPARIRATYQPAGDHVADNGSPTGQQLNRRVEIELYQALPVALSATTVAQP